VAEWQNRPLERLYMVVWMDGIVFKVRESGKVINKTVYLCVGLNTRGYKEGHSVNKKRIPTICLQSSWDFVIFVDPPPKKRFRGQNRGNHKRKDMRKVQKL
jgi:Transposase and inactivated derivatives